MELGGGGWVRDQAVHPKARTFKPSSSNCVAQGSREEGKLRNIDPKILI